VLQQPSLHLYAQSRAPPSSNRSLERRHPQTVDFLKRALKYFCYNIFGAKFQTAHNPSSLSASNRPRLQMGKPKRTKGTTAAAARAGWDVVCVRRSVCAHSRLQIFPFILRIMNRARARAGERWAISWPPLSDTDSLFSSHVHAHACLYASV